jgi:hypothetical protein
MSNVKKIKNKNFFHFIVSKLMQLLKLTLYQNLIVIHPKVNNNFKSHINLKRIKRKTKKLLHLSIMPLLASKTPVANLALTNWGG